MLAGVTPLKIDNQGSFFKNFFGHELKELKVRGAASNYER